MKINCQEQYSGKEYYHGLCLMEICAKTNAGLLFLPPSSPDLNPIEKDRATMKHCLYDTTPLDDLLETAIYN
jgi:transposase